MNDRAPKPAADGPKKRKKKKRPDPVYVGTGYPVWLGALSLGWALFGWAVAALAPRLSMLPGVGLLHLVMPTVTVALIGANLFLAVRDLRRGVHVLGLLVVTALQVGLFTTLFFQLYAHGGAELFSVQGPVYSYQWLLFSAAHALRASDALDAIEAFSLHTQAVKHTGSLVAVFVIAYHVVIDVFFLGVLWKFVGGVRDRLLEDEGIRGLVVKAAQFLFGLWLIAWAMIAIFYSPWSAGDVPLWLVENVLRVIDFADVMESFNWRLHALPREGLTGALTFTCRLWIGIAIAVLLSLDGKKARDRVKALATPPGASAGAVWGRRFAAVGAVLAAFALTTQVSGVLAGEPSAWLAAEATGADAGRSAAAHAALRRMGPSAEAAAPLLSEARKAQAGDSRDQTTVTLGYLGPKAVDALARAARESDVSAALAVNGLGRIGAPAAAELVAIWAATPSDAVRQAAADELNGLGADAVPTLMAAAGPDNAAAVVEWLPRLDRNWDMRGAVNPFVARLQKMGGFVQRIKDENPRYPDMEAYIGLRDCGPAAVGAVPLLVERLQTPAKTEAAAVIRAIGKPATGEMLRRLAAEPNIAGGVTPLLAAADMWDADLVRLPGAVPLLKSQAIANLSLVPVLGLAGPAAKSAVPEMFVALAQPDPEQRAAARKALDAVDPAWPKRSDLGRVIPELVVPLGELPEADAAPVLAVLGPIDESRVPDLLGLFSRLAPRDEDQPELVKAVERGMRRLGARLKPAAPALVKAMEIPIVPKTNRSGEVIGREPAKRTDAQYRIAAILPHVGADPAEVARAVLRFDPAAAGYSGLLDSPDPAAVAPFLPALLDSDDAGLKARAELLVTKLGPAASACLPRLVSRLGGSAGDQLDVASAELLPKRFAQLAAVDPEWLARPDAAPALSCLLHSFQSKPTRELYGLDDRAKRSRQWEALRADAFREILAIKDKAPKLGPALAARLVPADDVDGEVAALLDGLDPKWRDTPEVAAAVPDLITGADPRDKHSGRTLAHLGSAVVPGLAKLLKEGDDGARARALKLAEKVGPAAKSLAPQLAAEFATFPDNPFAQRRAGEILETLWAIDPGWARLPGVADSVVPLFDRAMRYQAQEVYPFYSRLPQAAPELVMPPILKCLKEKGDASLYAMTAAERLGPAAKDAVPALVKIATDPKDDHRTNAVGALAKIAPRDPKAVAAGTALLRDSNYTFAMMSPKWLDAIDPDWRKSAAAKPGLTKLLADLKLADARGRQLAMHVALEVGPDAPGFLAAVKAMKVEDIHPDSQKARADWLKKHGK